MVGEWIVFVVIMKLLWLIGRKRIIGSLMFFFVKFKFVDLKIIIGCVEM